MLTALLAVRAWDVRANGLPAQIAQQVQKAIEQAAPQHAVVDALAFANRPAPPRPRLAHLRHSEDDGHPE